MRLRGVDDATNELTSTILDAAMSVHTRLGPGLLESPYAVCLARELRKRGLVAEQEVPFRLIDDGEDVGLAFRIDILVERRVVVEVKAVHAIDDIHRAQVLTYLRVSGARVGLIINFHEPHLRDGIARLVL